MKIIKGYEHNVGTHCESGSLRNLLKHSGLNISEPMLFGIGSGLAFAYMSNIKGVGGFPLTAIRLPMGVIIKKIEKLCKIEFFKKKFKTTEEAIQKANQMLNTNQAVVVCVDMYYMKYLPAFMHVHVPFHFIVLVGRDEKSYAISDPYYSDIGILDINQLKLAWQTHAAFANDNLLAYVKNIPKDINWKKAIKKAFSTTCLNMLLQVGVRKILPIFGVEGIKFFAKKMLSWPKKYQGFALREGLLYTPTIFEEQGTGGGAFRILYGAFLQEAADIFNSNAIGELANRMLDIGEKWRDASRDLVKVGKKLPMQNEEYPDWYKKNKESLSGSLKEISTQFIQIADLEKIFFEDLKKINKDLKDN